MKGQIIYINNLSKKIKFHGSSNWWLDHTLNNTVIFVENITQQDGLIPHSRGVFQILESRYLESLPTNINAFPMSDVGKAKKF